MEGLSKEDMIEAYNNNLAIIHSIEISKLIPFKDHPFKLYTGERFKDMVESIKLSGVHIPIIVRLIKDTDTYEILSGHNRVEASKEAGLTEVPAIVRKDLTDDEAMLIVTETNLIQRSFSDLSHSERAIALVKHYEAIKKQGKRTDLINEITYLLDKQKNPKAKKDETLSPVDTKSDSKKEIGEKYDISRATVARYIRIDKLTDDLKKRVDNGEIAIRSAVELSFLKKEEQKMLEKVLKKYSDCKVDTVKAKELRALSNDPETKFTEIIIEAILTNQGDKSEVDIKTIKDIKNKYFPNKKNNDEIMRIIKAALDMYFQSEMDIKADSIDYEE